MDRRSFLTRAGAVTAMLTARSNASPRSAAPTAKSADTLRALARKALAANSAQIAHHDVVALADFSEPSWRRRFHLVDMKDGAVASYLVAHGKGSDLRHTGMLESFSDAPNSEATSRGAYRSAGEYIGEHGRSLRLDGLDPTNANARSRAVVIHAAWYVSEAMLQRYGMLGRSQGCFVFRAEDLGTILNRLGSGRLLYADKL